MKGSSIRDAEPTRFRKTPEVGQYSSAQVGQYSWTQPLSPARWNDDVSLRMSIRHSVVDSLTIICAVGYHRRDPRCDLIKKTHYFRYVADIVRRQFGDHDVVRIGVDADVQLTPASA